AGGDETSVALDLTNLTGSSQQLSVRVEAEGQLSLATAAYSAELRLAQSQRETLRIPVRALGGYGAGVLRISVEGLSLPGENLPAFTREWRIGVRSAWPAQQTHLRSVLQGQPWQLPAGTLAAFEPAGREALLSVSSRPPLNLAEQIRELRAYPYGCLEQTASGLFPALYADSATLKQLGLDGEPDEQRRRAIEIGIERLLGMQRYNGGFALWNAEGEEEHWLTAYVTDFLLRAREQGFAVSPQALEKATARLLRYLQDRQLVDPGYSENLEHTRFAVQAYAGLVLARSQQAPLGSLRALYERRTDARSGLPLVQLAVALQKMGDKPRAEEALTLGLGLGRERRDWLADYGSPLRDQAL